MTPASVKLLRTQSDERLAALALARGAAHVGDARAAEQRTLSGPPVGDPLHIAFELAAVELFLRHSPRNDGARGGRGANPGHHG